jgi:hypothetical protein
MAKLELLKQVNELSKITRAIVGEALSKTRGKDRQTIITDIQKIIKQYRGK